MFHPEDLQKGNLTSTKEADELDAMLANAGSLEDISLEDISLEENLDNTLIEKSSGQAADETVRNVKEVSFIDEDVDELNARLDEKNRIITKLQAKIQALEEKAEMCVCKKKRSREKSLEKSYRCKSKSKKMWGEHSDQKRDKSRSKTPPKEKHSIAPKREKWTPKHKVVRNFAGQKVPIFLFFQITFEKQTKKIHPGVKRFKDQHVEG